MGNSSRRIFLKSAALTGMVAPFVQPVFAWDDSRGMLQENNSFATDEKDNYLDKIKQDLQIAWPKNRTINLVFHGHSVPSGYFKTPDVRPLQAYPHLLLKALKNGYPHAVINTILTCIGGENSKKGADRFKKEVLNHRPDVLFIDYALNDRGIGLDASLASWEYMIKAALKKNIKVILLTATPDQKVDINDNTTDLQKICDQIRVLAKKYNIGLVDSYAAFQKRISAGEILSDYMSQVNHPNEKGHQLVTEGIMKYF